jgi:PKD repeat protein
MSGSGLVGSGYRWEFGDGEVSELPAPVHVYAQAGEYPVRLTVETASGPVVVSKTVSVSSATTLSLNGGRFDVSMTARDQRTERTGEGQAIPENDLFGYFSIPALTSQPDNPEMFVKILDARAVNGQFWVFYNGLTDLDVTLTVRENPTGIVKTYRKDPGSACGGFDTSGFIGGGQSPTATPPGATVTPTPPGPTPTPTTPPSSTTIVELVGTRFDWNARIDGTPSGPNFTLRVGQTYEFRIRSGDPPGTASHAFSGIPTLNLSAANINPGGQPVVRTITINAGQVGSHLYACTLTSCGDGHNDMVGNITVVP